MAIDTAIRRMAALQAGAETTTAGMGFPSGTIDAPSRANLLWIYDPTAFEIPPSESSGGRITPSLLVNPGRLMHR